MGFPPLALLNRPTKIPELHFVRQVFERLSRCRSWNDSGPQPITMESFFAYCHGLGMYQDLEDLLDMVQAMDQTYMTEVIKATKKGSDSDDAASKSVENSKPAISD